MHSFLWTGKDPEGRERSERVSAENAKAAKAALVERGWTELRLITDEAVDVARQNIPRQSGTEEPIFTPDEEADRWQGHWPSFAGEWWKAVVQAKGLIALLGVIAIAGMYSHKKSVVVVAVIGILVVLLLFPAISGFLSMGTRYFSRLNKAKVWGRWNEVLLCVERLKQIRRLTRIGIGDFELARNRAIALAGLGRLEEGLAELFRFTDSPRVPHWVYLAMLSEVYDVAHQFEKALEIRLQAVNEKSDNASLWVDVAYSLVRGLNRPAEARRALARAESGELPEVGRPFLTYVKGIICWREGKPGEAKQHLEKALAEFQRLTHFTLIEGPLLFATAHLCAVNGALGNAAEARKLFHEIEQFLLAHREEELLQACRRGI